MRVSNCDATFNQSDVRTLGVRVSGFSGSMTCTVQGPTWLTCAPARASSRDDFVLTAAAGRAVGTYAYTVTVTDSAGSRASASCSVEVTGGTPPPPPALTMADVTITAEPGSTYTGGLNAIGGPEVTRVYEWENAVPEDEIGLVLGVNSGDFSGTVPTDTNIVGQTYTYTAKVTRGTASTTCTVTVVIQSGVTPPPVLTECFGGSASAPVGGVAGVPLVSCTSPYTPLTASDGTTPAGWTATWTDPETLTDPTLTQEGAGVAFSFSTTVPSGAVVGQTYKLHAEPDGHARDDGDGDRCRDRTCPQRSRHHHSRLAVEHQPSGFVLHHADDHADRRPGCGKLHVRHLHEADVDDLLDDGGTWLVAGADSPTERGPVGFLLVPCREGRGEQGVHRYLPIDHGRRH